MNQEYNQEIKKLRNNIDDIDQKILALFAQRFDVINKVGILKKQHNISPLQPARWNEVLENICQKGGQKGLSKDFIKNIWNNIHQEALKIENKTGLIQR